MLRIKHLFILLILRISNKGKKLLKHTQIEETKQQVLLSTTTINDTRERRLGYVLNDRNLNILGMINKKQKNKK
jgi:hypothetical protein